MSLRHRSARPARLEWQALGGEGEHRATIRHRRWLAYQMVAHDCHDGTHDVYVLRHPQTRSQRSEVR